MLNNGLRVDRGHAQPWRPDQTKVGGNQRRREMSGDHDVDGVGDGDVAAELPCFRQERRHLDPPGRGSEEAVKRHGGRAGEIVPASSRRRSVAATSAKYTSGTHSS